MRFKRLSRRSVILLLLAVGMGSAVYVTDFNEILADRRIATAPQLAATASASVQSAGNVNPSQSAPRDFTGNDQSSNNWSRTGFSAVEEEQRRVAIGRRINPEALKVNNPDPLAARPQNFVPAAGLPALAAGASGVGAGTIAAGTAAVAGGTAVAANSGSKNAASATSEQSSGSGEPITVPRKNATISDG